MPHLANDGHQSTRISYIDRWVIGKREQYVVHDSEGTPMLRILPVSSGQRKTGGRPFATFAATRNGKELVKTLAISPPLEYNANEELTRRKPLSFHKLQHHPNVTATPRVGRQVRLRA